MFSALAGLGSSIAGAFGSAFSGGGASGFFGNLGLGIGNLFGDSIGGASIGSSLGSGLSNLFSSGLGGSLLNFGLGQASARSYLAQQKELMYLQHALNLDAYGQRHQLEVSDLKKAGLNPILSANSGGSVTSSAGLPSAQSIADQMDKIGSAKNRVSTEDLIRAQVQQSASSSGLNTAQAQATLMNAITNRMQTAGDLSLKKIQEQLNISLKALNAVRTANESRYPANQGSFEKNLRGVVRMVEDTFNRSFSQLVPNVGSAQEAKQFLNGTD